MVPDFLEGKHGRLFAASFLPPTRSGRALGVLCVPPFAEEMNKGRRMMALQARALAHRGVSVLMLDHYGTGDSAGDFRDARWEIWKDDVELGVEWLHQAGAKQIALWGIRLGCLLAADYVQNKDDRITQLVFWQPVVSGKQMVTQFLRLRLAAGAIAGTAQETVAQMRQRLAAGELLEVAGYELSHHLIASIEALHLSSLIPPPTVPVDWFEVVPKPERPLTPVSRQILKVWQSTGVFISTHLVTGDAFWATQEIALAPELIQRTSEILESSFGEGNERRQETAPS